MMLSLHIWYQYYYHALAIFRDLVKIDEIQGFSIVDVVSAIELCSILIDATHAVIDS